MNAGNGQLLAVDTNAQLARRQSDVSNMYADVVTAASIGGFVLRVSAGGYCRSAASENDLCRKALRLIEAAAREKVLGAGQRTYEPRAAREQLSRHADTA